MDKEIKPVPTSIVYNGHTITAEQLRRWYWDDGACINSGIPANVEEITGIKPAPWTVRKWFNQCGIQKRTKSEAIKLKKGIRWGENGLPTIGALFVRYWGLEGHRPHSSGDLQKMLLDKFGVSISQCTIVRALKKEDGHLRTRSSASKIAYKFGTGADILKKARAASYVSEKQKTAIKENGKKANAKRTSIGLARARARKLYCPFCGNCTMGLAGHTLGKQKYECLSCRRQTVNPLTTKPQMVNGKPVLPPKPPRVSKPRQESPKPTPKVVDEMELTDAEIEMMKRFRGES